MKKLVGTIIMVIILIASIVLGFIKGVNLAPNQIETLKILVIVAASSALYCFVVGEISHNNSQMDKLWSILPIAYTWIVAIKGNMSLRLVIIAILVTLWGIRLTFNFARKGAYSIKFWTGVEDYRWLVLRKKKILSNKIAWMLFDLFFISIYQNGLVLAMTLPAVAIMNSTASFGVFDIIVALIVLAFLVIETISDEQQWKFYSKKHELLKDGKSLAEIESPYNKGFNTTGLWAYSRHPNYLGEQGFWVSIYLFVIASNVCHFGIFNWSIFGCALIVLLFIGSSSFGESVSANKYPDYSKYQQSVSKYIPLRKYQG